MSEAADLYGTQARPTFFAGRPHRLLHSMFQRKGISLVDRVVSDVRFQGMASFASWADFRVRSGPADISPRRLSTLRVRPQPTILASVIALAPASSTHAFGVVLTTQMGITACLVC